MGLRQGEQVTEQRRIHDERAAIDSELGPVPSDDDGIAIVEPEPRVSLSRVGLSVVRRVTECAIL